MRLPDLLDKARKSGFRRWLLDRLLHRLIPFNKPHGLAVYPLAEGIRVHVPYRRANRNHIAGVHACCLATAAEYCCGLALLEKLDAKTYRLIMSELRMVYHYQAKSAVDAVYALPQHELEKGIREALASEGVALHTCQVELHDANGKHVATGWITWQVKEWKRVRTKPIAG